MNKMSMTPDQHRKVGMGVSPSPTPFYTPRPERRRTEPRLLDWNSNRQDRDREVNVQVLLRCRPLSEDEQRANVPKVISCNEHKREVTILQSLANKQIDRIFTFDKIFGPKAQQRSIYDQAITPIVNEVLEGFNCTVFAYGQTGTGKTYTMEGGMTKKGGELPAEAGVIPRAVRQIFDTLEAQNADYSMKVSFLELYNEELTDLLAPEDYSRTMEDRQKKPISLMEDGKGCVIVRGLEEEAVYSAAEIYSLLERGAAKRRTADTLLNKRSSRSHSVFSITIYIKEATVGDEELIKCGKLNLVDLAGSENISRSGAREGRAREAGEINKSLLTLGRVINALVEHSGHIPYRDSKLTRLLRDSLGGKTKTCIIATISPSAHCLEETLSTLDYACRAKSIKNKPEANQKMSKTVLLKDLYMEIERMKQDVRAAREKNGVYISQERFAQDEAEKKAKNERIEQLENDVALSVKEADKYLELYHTEQEEKLDIQSELSDCKLNLENSRKALQELQENHKAALSTIKEKENTIFRLLQSENSLIARAKGLSMDLQCASEDINALFTSIDRKDKMEAENHGLVLTFGSQLDQSLKGLHKIILGLVSQQRQHLKCMEEHVRSFLASKSDVTQSLESRIKRMMESYTLGLGALKELINTLKDKTCSEMEQIKSTMSNQTNNVENLLENVVLEANEVIHDIQNCVSGQQQLLTASAQKQNEGLQRTLASAQVITQATVNFFNDIHDHASRLMMTIEQSEMEKHRQLETFEKVFKEEAAREEKVAVEKIASILANLTLKRTSMVSEATRNIHDLSAKERQRMQQEITGMQHVSSDAKEGLTDYLEKVKGHFLEDTFSSTETMGAVDYCLKECLSKLKYSSQQWENAKLTIRMHNRSNVADLESSLKEHIGATGVAYEDIVSRSTSMIEESDARACEILEAVNNSLMLDNETKKELDCVCDLCSDHLKLVQGKHTESISSIRNKAEQCLVKDYLVDRHTAPKKRVIDVPTLASLEEIRTALSEDVRGHSIAENRSKWGYPEDKIQQQQQLFMPASPNRTPFADVN